MFSPIDITPVPSVYERYLLHALVLLCLLAIGLVSLKYPLCSVLAGVVFWFWRDQLKRLESRPYARFIWDLNAQSAKLNVQGQWYHCQQLSQLFVSQYLLSFVCVLEAGKRVRLTILLDAVSVEEFRRLKVALTFARQLTDTTTHN